VLNLPYKAHRDNSDIDFTELTTSIVTEAKKHWYGEHITEDNYTCGCGVSYYDYLEVDYWIEIDAVVEINPTIYAERVKTYKLSKINYESSIKKYEDKMKRYEEKLAEYETHLKTLKAIKHEKELEKAVAILEKAGMVVQK